MGAIQKGDIQGGRGTISWIIASEIVSSQRRIILTDALAHAGPSPKNSCDWMSIACVCVDIGVAISVRNLPAPWAFAHEGKKSCANMHETSKTPIETANWTDICT